MKVSKFIGLVFLTSALVCGMIFLSDYRKLPDCPDPISTASDVQTRAAQIKCGFQGKCTVFVSDNTTVCGAP